MASHIIPQAFLAGTVAAVSSLSWAPRWLISGAPILTYCLLVGAATGHRILPFVGTWTLLATLNLFYAISATSWLLYWVFAASCYPAIFFTCLFQFSFVAVAVRRALRSLLQHLHFTRDKIAFFDLPALEIDTEVDGLMVIRGITLSLSSLTIVAHGVEVGIKISDDCELALQVEEVTIPLFRSVDIGDVYGNVKGGEFEMNFGKLAGRTHAPDGEPLMQSDTPLLQAAASMSEENLTRMPEKMANGKEPKHVSPEEGLKSVTTLSADEEAIGRYLERLEYINGTNNIHQCRAEIEEHLSHTNTDRKSFNLKSKKDRRAAICSQLHAKPTIAHPPRKSIRVTTLQQLGPPWLRRLLHRMPMLYRLILNPISYFHPVHIASITAAGSGKWIEFLLQDKIFKQHAEHDSSMRNLQHRLATWLTDANFALELADIKGTAQVPFITGHDIICRLRVGDVMAYRTLPKEVDLKQVVRLGGADTTVLVPSFLLPHHEHLFPPRPMDADERAEEMRAKHEEGKPQIIQAENRLEQLRKDEANVNISVHARLPACFDQELLDFVATLVKATKMIEMERELDSDDSDEEGDDPARSFKETLKNLNARVKDKVKRGTVNVVANDRWISKMVGKITKKLETAQGDVGYSGDLPVPLKPYRDNAETGSKILA